MSSAIWQCLACTLENPTSETLCQLCRTPRPTDPNAGLWSCEVCTFENARGDHSCVLCRAPRPANGAAEPLLEEASQEDIDIFIRELKSDIKEGFSALEAQRLVKILSVSGSEEMLSPAELNEFAVKYELYKGRSLTRGQRRVLRAWADTQHQTSWLSLIRQESLDRVQRENPQDWSVATEQQRRLFEAMLVEEKKRSQALQAQLSEKDSQVRAAQQATQKAQEDLKEAKEAAQAPSKMLEDDSGLQEGLAMMLLERQQSVEDQRRMTGRTRSPTKNREISTLPSTWQPQRQPCELFTVDKKSTEYTKIIGPFLADLKLQDSKRRVSIRKLQRIQNKLLWIPYAAEKVRLTIKLGGNPNEKIMYHGTKSVDPEIIYRSQRGFDHSMGSTNGMFGPGIYFAENALYSDLYYKHTRGGTRSLLIANVLAGDYKDYKSTYSNMRRPPEKAAFVKNRLHEFYDSVGCKLSASQGNCSKNMVVVYDNCQCYPSYLVEYTAS